MKLTQKLAINYIRAKLQIWMLVSKKKAAKKMFDLFCTPRLKSKRKRPSLFDKSEKLSFRLEGHTIRGYKWPAIGSEKEPTKRLLILHGFESTIQKFEQYIALFQKKGYEVIGFDAPAHGQSGGRRINLPLYARMVQKIIESFGPIEYFMAHSFGGAALVHALEGMETHNPTRLVLIAPATESTTSIDLFFQFLQIEDVEVRKEFNNLIQEKTGFPPEHFSIRRAIKNIKAGILWFHDQEDKITPISDVRKVQEDNPQQVHFIFTNGLGHRQIYRDPGVIQQVSEFL